MRTLWSVLAILLSSAVLAAQAPLEETSATITAAVRLREAPKMAARMVERLTPKTEVYVTICSNGWCQVSVGTHSGYVPRRFLVKRAAPPPPAVRSPAPRSDSLGWEPPPATSQDMWQVVHSMKGVSHYTILQVDAVAPVRGPLREFRPSLHILCDTAGLSVYLMTSAVLLADTRHTPVRVFWGATRSPPPPTPWILSREHSAAFVPGPDDFVRKVLRNPDLGIEFRLVDEGARTASFNTRGLRNHLPELEAQCPCFEGLTWTARYCGANRLDSVYLATALDEVPQLVSAPELEYPPELRRIGIEGHVIVEAILDTTGHVEFESVELVQGANPEFDSAAVNYVRAAVFRPARLHGQAVRALVRLPINFVLRRE